jgi:hypothetical protein
MRLCKPSAWYRVCLALSGSLVFLGLAPVLDVQGIKTGTGYIPTSAGEGAMFGEIACLAGVAILTLTLLVRFRVLKLS